MPLLRSVLTPRCALLGATAAARARRDGDAGFNGAVQVSTTAPAVGVKLDASPASGDFVAAETRRWADVVRAVHVGPV